MIYCVIPPELEGDLYESLVEHYRDNPNVTVMLDRRQGADRRKDTGRGGKRELRDRRRLRAAGTFLPTDPPQAA